MRIVPLPSPKGTNRAGKFFIENAPSGYARTMAMDAINRGIAVDGDTRKARDQKERPPNHSAFRQELASVLDQCAMHGAHRAMVDDVLDRHFGRMGDDSDGEHSAEELRRAKDKVYGDTDSESEESWYRHEDEPTEIKEPDGADSEEVAQREWRHPENERHFAKYPDRHRFAEAEAEGRGLARRLEAGDRRRRGGRDHALGMDYASARESLDDMFGTGRIKDANDLR
jgi:hypothetical protein